MRRLHAQRLSHASLQLSAAALCFAALLTTALPVAGAAAPTTAAAWVSVINEAEWIPAGLAVTTSVPPAAGGSDVLFASVAGGATTPHVAVRASPQTISFVNVTTGHTVETLLLDPAPNSQYSLFVSSTGQATPPLAVATLRGPAASDWPQQRTDKALFRVVSADLSHPAAAINTTSANCWQCLAVFRTVAVAASIVDPGFLTASVPHPIIVRVSAWGDPSAVVVHEATYDWLETGVYTLVLPAASRGGAGAAYLVAHDGGRSVAVPLVVWAVVLVVLVLCYNALWLCYSRFGSAGDTDSLPHLSAPAADLASHATYEADAATTGAARIKPGSKGRVVSIDTFRGMALAIMIFVNYGGGGYWFLNHSWWNGLTVADLVFPWFVWIMGTSMAISHASAKRKGISTPALLLKVFIRSVKLFCIGLFLNNGMDLSNWRILGVLQYFAVSGLAVGVVSNLVPRLPVGGVAATEKPPDLTNAYGAVVTGPAASAEYDVMVVRRGQPKFADCLPFLLQWFVVFVFVGVYLCIQFLLDVPGCGRGYFGPGGNGNFGQHRGCTGGAHGYVDRQIFGEHHIYHDLDAAGVPISAATCHGVTRYDCNVYDPEGTLGFLTATFICFMGLQAGRILVTYREHNERLLRWITWGLVEVAIGTALCGASQNDGIIPLTKNLWSPSFVLVMAGTGNLVLSLFYWLVDVKHWWAGAPFKYVGMNSIMVYAGSELLQNFLPFTIMLKPPIPDDNLGFHSHTSALVGNSIGVATWFLIAFLFARNKFFVNV